MSGKEVSGQDYMIAARVLDEHGITEPCGTIDSLPSWLRAEGERLITEEARIDGLAWRLRRVWRRCFAASADHASFEAMTPESQDAWRAVAREAIAAHAEARLRRNPETVASIHQSLSTTVGDCEVLADGSLGEPEDWAARADAPVTIPVDATGLKGRMARVVGPLIYSDGSPVSWSLQDALVVKILRLDGDGDAHVEIAEGRYWGDDGHIAASSLAPIPEPEPAPVEPPVGTRLRDKDGVIRTRLESGWSTPISMIQWPNLVKNFGPLHQVFADWADIPEGVIATDDLGDKVQGCPPGCTKEHRFVAPFVAVEPYGEAQ